jgi:hypothetical protein
MLLYAKRNSMYWKPVLRRFQRHDEIAPSSYFIGCSEWKMNEKFHRFISINEKCRS